MKYLLIDFGASNIKSATYDTISQKLENYSKQPSPFLHNHKIHKQDTLQILKNLLNQQTVHIDKIYLCSILGGKYIGDYYYSWQSDYSTQEIDVVDCCLISGLFKESELFHMHIDHFRPNTRYKYLDTCQVLGYIQTVPVYTAMGDTQCVIAGAKNSIKGDYGAIVNLGTGSQVIHICQGKEQNRYSYIPSGRALNVFQNFFKELGADFFSIAQKINLSDILNSSIIINLNVFNQSHKFSIDGGSICNIHEKSFNVKNFVASVIRCYLDQYGEFLVAPYDKNIIICGGVSHNIPVITPYMEHKYRNSNISISSVIDETFIGMKERIENNYVTK